MKPFLLVFLGGGLGSALRYYISKSLTLYYPSLYLGTLVVNIVGCLLLGFLFSLSLRTGYISQSQMLLLATGFCGGFTTFSTFALEGHELLKNAPLSFFLYLGTSIIVGLLALGAGIWCSKFV